jgi:hypothetical protein
MLSNSWPTLAGEMKLPDIATRWLQAFPLDSKFLAASKPNSLRPMPFFYYVCPSSIEIGTKEATLVRQPSLKLEKSDEAL